MADLLKNDSKLFSEFDFSKNQDIDIDTITLGSNKKVWWICKQGHSFSQTIDNRHNRGYGCPYCSGKKVLVGYNDLCTVKPELAGEWDCEKNRELMPQSVTLHSNKKVWWKCRICGFSWESKVNDRANGRGCPACSKKKRIKSFRENNYLVRGVNDLSTLRPDLVNEWNYDKNNSINPEDYTCSSHLKVWWKCLICGNEWEATIKNRAENESGCPKCKKYARTSFPEQALLFYLRQMYPSAENSYTEIFYPTNRELDIFIPELKIGIEYDGQVWHSDERSRKVGIEKYEICKKNNIKLIRVSESPEKTDDNCDVFIYRDGFTSSSLDNAIKNVIAIISPNKIEIDTVKDRTPIISQYFGIIKNKSIAVKCPEVIKEWDCEKNGGITPEMVNYSSNGKYWWKCEKGHSYQATPANKCIQKSGCPICSGRIVLKGFNDLQTRFPEIAAEWDDERNQPVQAFDVASGSIKKYWWLCPKGHSYTASPNSRTSNKSGCPYCAGKKVLPGFNDILSTNPTVGQFWNYNKNKGIDPKQFSAGSSEKVWWVCPNGHEYEKKIVSFVNYPNCPVCNGRLLQTGINDLQTTHPNLVKEWDYKKNTISPENITRTFAGKVWWKCNTCGTEWQQKVNVRVISGSGCPRCGYKIKLGETRRRNAKKK